MTNYRQSQTLIEVIVAIGIVVVALTGIISIALSYMAMGGSTAERTTAIFLAREGIELIWGLRSSQWLDPTKTWPYSLTNGNWTFDSDMASLSAAGTSDITACDPCKLYLSASNPGKYTHTSGGGNTSTLFRRMITIADGDNLGSGSVCASNCEKKITATVYWVERSRAHQISIEDRLTDWR